MLEELREKHADVAVDAHRGPHDPAQVLVVDVDMDQVPALRLRICANGREITQDSCMLSFANTPSFGGGLRIAPHAKLDDGALECVLVQKMGRLKLLRSAIALLRVRHLQLKEVTSFSSERLRIESNPPTWVFADGEPMCQTPIDVHVIPRALRLLSA